MDESGVGKGRHGLPDYEEVISVSAIDFKDFYSFSNFLEEEEEAGVGLL